MGVGSFPRALELGLAFASIRAIKPHRAHAFLLHCGCPFDPLQLEAPAVLNLADYLVTVKLLVVPH